MLHRSVASSSALLLVALAAGCTATQDDDQRSERRTSYLELQEPAPTRCAGTLGAVEVAGDLVVPRERTCRLEGTAVDGRVSVTLGASLVARDARFGEGISAHGFRRVALLGGRVDGRPRAWSYAPPGAGRSDVDFVFDGGRDVVVEDGPSDGHYYVIGNSGRVRLVGLSLDTGEIFCARNRRRPEVRGVSGETPGKLQGQCAGLRNFASGSDF